MFGKGGSRRTFRGGGDMPHLLPTGACCLVGRPCKAPARFRAVRAFVSFNLKCLSSLFDRCFVTLKLRHVIDLVVDVIVMTLCREECGQAYFTYISHHTN